MRVGGGGGETPAHVVCRQVNLQQLQLQVRTNAKQQKGQAAAKLFFNCTQGICSLVTPPPKNTHSHTCKRTHTDLPVPPPSFPPNPAARVSRIPAGLLWSRWLPAATGPARGPGGGPGPPQNRRRAAVSRFKPPCQPGGVCGYGAQWGCHCQGLFQTRIDRELTGCVQVGSALQAASSGWCFS